MKTVIFLGMYLFLGDGSPKTTIELVSLAPYPQEIVVGIAGINRTFHVDAEGVATISLDINKPQMVSWGDHALYVEPGKTLRAMKSPDTHRLTFTGETGAENELLSSGFPGKYAMEYSGLIAKGEMTFDAYIDTIMKADAEALLSVSPQFRDLVYSMEMWRYAPERMDGLLIEPDYMEMYQYRNYLGVQVNKLNPLAKRGVFVKKAKELEEQIDFVERTFPDPAMREFLINQDVLRYIEDHGYDDNEQLIARYRKSVSNPKAIARFDQLLAPWEPLKRGSVCPDFTFCDIDGKPVSLSSFRGKYVYIDIWATWCQPCREQLPYLAELEEKCEGRNIVFIGIANEKKDESGETWRKMVKAQKLDGIQLIMDKDKSFLDKVNCKFIPRFMLIDPQGRFVSVVMPLPSDPDTDKIFSTLKNL